MTETLLRVPVETSQGPYQVVVGPGARHSLAGMVPAGAARVAVVTQEGLPWEVDPDLPNRRFVIPGGEAAKTLSVVEDLCRSFARWGLTRDDVVVGLGGGVVTDVAGFAASVYHRGVAVLHVATTLLAQVDAAIGGKCGVNLPEGKNLVGAFWQPSGVLCDTDMLSSLPPREWASGRGEMAKYAFLGVEGLVDLPLAEQVARCVAHKAVVVAADEREQAGEEGGRALLNYGHTLAHALESATMARGGDLRHGEAVAIGLVFAAVLARRLGRVGEATVTMHREVVQRLGLPDHLPDDVDAAELLERMGRDKKAVHGLTFILPGPSGLEVVSGVEPAVVRAALAEHLADG